LFLAFDGGFTPLHNGLSQTSASYYANGFTVGYSYDEAGNVIELTYPGNKKVIYTYDELNRMKTVTIDWLNPKPVATYYYDNAGRLTSLTNFNGTVTTYGYDNANRLTALDNKKSDTSVIASYSCKNQCKSGGQTCLFTFGDKLC
jgi:YD repeat-containing protein